MTDRKEGRRKKKKKSGVYKRFSKQDVPAVMHAIPQVSNIATCLARFELVRLFHHPPDVFDPPDNKVIHVVGVAQA